MPRPKKAVSKTRSCVFSARLTKAEHALIRRVSEADARSQASEMVILFKQRERQLKKEGVL